MKQEKEIPVLLMYGGAKKSGFDMSEEEFNAAATAIKNRAKEKAFSKGLPIYSSKGADLIAEYPDGHMVIIESKNG